MRDIWLATGLAMLIAAGAAAADDVPISVLERGAEILLEDCGGCHATAREGESPLAKAPLFRDLSKRFAIEGLAEALAEGIMTGHPEMPERSYQPADIDAILAYLDSIQSEATP
jgi:mono/diheme cytochrome c family protein